MVNSKIELLRRLWLSVYGFYCKLLFPFYRRLKVGSFDLVVNHPDIMPPLSSSGSLLFGDIRGKKVLDVGTGCGIVALTARRRGARYVLGVDINAAAISNAEPNLKNNFPNSCGIEFRQGDLYQDLTDKFDIIVSNPPYFRELPTLRRDYKYCGGDILEKILMEGKQHLEPAGEIRVLHPISSKSYMISLAEKYDYDLGLLDHVREKDNGWLRLLLGHTIRPGLRIYTFKSN